MLTLPTDIFIQLMELLPYDQKKQISSLCQTLHKWCGEIEGGWKSYLQSHMICFRDECKYVSTPTGWVHTMGVYTVHLPIVNKRKAESGPRNKTVFIGAKRHKVYLRGGCETIRLGPNWKYQSLRAADTQIDHERIRTHNQGWSETL